jgi:hypothetical protein
MSRILTLFGISALICSCTMKEEYVSEGRVIGLYMRESYSEKEFLCLKDDHTYHYFLKKNDSEETLKNGKWSFDNVSGKSYVGLNNFNYSIALKKYLKDTSGIGVPVKYSYAKKAVLLRMDADLHSQDFVRIDSTSCEAKSPD